MENQPQTSQHTLGFLKEYLSYNPNTGLFTRRISVGGKHGKRLAAGTVAGSPNKEGYRYVRVDGRQYKTSRLAWFFMTGEWPTEQVDHIDHDTGNDRWSNLRLATQSQNKANCRPYKKKSCTLKGVQAVQKRHSIRYRAVVTKEGVRHHLGNFGTELEAHLAYVKASAALHGQFSFSGTELNNG